MLVPDATGYELTFGSISLFSGSIYRLEICTVRMLQEVQLSHTPRTRRSPSCVQLDRLPSCPSGSMNQVQIRLLASPAETESAPVVGSAGLYAVDTLMNIFLQ